MDTSGVTGINIRIELDAGPALEMMRAANEALLDISMRLFYHDDLCDPEWDVFV